MITLRTNTLPKYCYGAARSMVHLRGLYLKECFEAWKQAKAIDLVLPETDDPSYVSLEDLLSHVLRADRGYIVWICKQLDLPDPEIEPTPALDAIAEQAEGYIAHLIERWAAPLANVEEKRFHRGEYESNWGVRYCIDAMLEHAVMHPILHLVQIKELIAAQTGERRNN
ncbi:MAG: hypothetical protein ISR58_06660 [Anaerolineales bacterium]|nr:hypothetical protein [Chloroflexota bacterium]MBL6980855.1 hypothetical protein [Anaerolineales bacterium]